PLDLGVPIVGAGGQVEVHPVLDRLGFRYGHEARADRRAYIRSDDDLARALGQDSPAQRLCPKACEARQTSASQPGPVLKLCLTRITTSLCCWGDRRSGPALASAGPVPPGRGRADA